MKNLRKITYLLILTMCLVLFSGCCIKHDWQEATCEEPETCSKCGKTRGEELGHDWEKATCEKPKTCKRCGETKGKELGHDWIEATCESPKTCKRCDKTEGEPLEHEWTFATVNEPKHCINCGKTEGDPVSVEMISMDDITGGGWDYVCAYEDSIVCAKQKGNEVKAGFYDYNGAVLNEISYSIANANSWSYTMPSDINNKIGLQTTLFDRNDNGTIRLYDPRGNELKDIDIKYPFSYSYMYLSRVADDQRYLAEVNAENNQIAYWLDTETLELIDAKKQNHVLWGIDYDYDASRYSYITRMINGGMSGFFVGDADETHWGYLDEDQNEIAMYKDATEFNIYGYALVSNDGNSYDIIDKDFNVVGENVIQGEGAYLRSGNSPVFAVKTASGYKDLLVK